MTYTKLMQDLHAYFGVIKPPPAGTIKLWAEEVGAYPEDFYDWAYSAIKNRENGFPKSPPTLLQSLWREWLRRNPAKEEKREFQCRQLACEGGYLFMWKDGPWVFVCGECKAKVGDNPLYPVRTFDQLIDAGYERNTVEGTRRRIEESKWKSGLSKVGAGGAGV